MAETPLTQFPHIENLFANLRSCLVRHYNNRGLTPDDIRSRPYFYSSLPGLDMIYHATKAKPAFAALIEELIAKKKAAKKKDVKIPKMHDYFEILNKNFLHEMKRIKDRDPEQFERIYRAIYVHSYAYAVEKECRSCTHARELRKYLGRLVEELEKSADKRNEALLRTLQSLMGLSKENTDNHPTWGYPALLRTSGYIMQLRSNEFAKLFERIDSLKEGRAYEDRLTNFETKVDEMLADPAIRKHQSGSFAFFYHLLKAHTASYRAYLQTGGGQWGMAMDQHVYALEHYRVIKRDGEIEVGLEEVRNIARHITGYGWRQKLPHWVEREIGHEVTAPIHHGVKAEA